MTPTSHPTASRRAFIAGALAAAGAALLDPVGLASARGRARSLAPGDLFPLGVGSGDPDATSVILWTRLLSPDAGDPLPAADVAVDWEVATDELFTDVVASGTAPAVAALAHSVHVEATGLSADTWYWYRFTVDGRTSPTGRTRTFPGAGATPAEVRFSVASCQNWSAGYYTAYAAMAAEDLDFVVFTGDYIYERSSSSGARPISLPESLDLPTYRARYELYKADENLRAAHAQFPWIITMDDHEVANNAVGDNGKDGGDAGDPAAIAAFRARRADAFQAWYEHLPLRLPAPTGADYVLYRTIVHSDLVRIFVLDGRQYRSLYPGGASAGLSVPERFAEDRSMLGTTQEAWLDAQLDATDARWNLLAQQTVMTATPLPTGGDPVYNFDQWDGYVANRNRLMASLLERKVANPLVLTGDIHMAGAGAIHLDAEDPTTPLVANEVVCTSISSNFNDAALDLFDALLEQAPWLRYANPRKRGYSVVTITPTEATIDFRVMATVAEPTSTVSTDHTDVVLAREPEELPPTTTTDPSTTTTAPGSTPTAPGATAVTGDPSYTG
jgi:alkaline phosphatase D